MQDAINFLQDAIEYLRGRDGREPDPDAARDAIAEALAALAREERA